MPVSPLSLAPYDDMAAMAVLSRLDPWDLREAEAVRGAGATHLALFADWRAMQGHCVLSLVLSWHRQPFAVLALSNTGQGGVAQAALLARDHRRYRRGLAMAARDIRRRVPAFCEELGIHRIEARAWAAHPRASAFLSAVGFRHECDMPGFGPDGAETFRQFAWTPATQSTEGDTPCA